MHKKFYFFGDLMVNVLTIARKEFSDLLTNGMVIVVLGVYLVFLGLSIYNFYALLSSGQLSDDGDYLLNSNLGVYCSEYVFRMVADFTLFIGVIIGCASMSNELHKYALNTLIVKPVYRDTIINGKLLGTLSFIFIIVAVTAILYTAGILVLCGNAFAPYLGDYLERTTVMFSVLIITAIIFMSLSMLVSILMRNQAFSLMIAVILLYISQFVPWFSNFINDVYQGMGELITSLSPYGLRNLISYKMFRPSLTVAEALSSSGSYIIGLLILLVLTMVINYIIFMRRDIS